MSIRKRGMRSQGNNREADARNRASRQSRSGRPVILLIDGHCLLCQGITRFVAERDKRAVFRFAALQSPTGRRLLAEGGLADGPDSFVLIEGGRCFVKSDAALRVFRRLGGAWPLLYGLKAVPPALRDAAYDWIARRRYRWFGRSETCLVPDEKIRSRFLPDGEEDEEETEAPEK